MVSTFTIQYKWAGRLSKSFSEQQGVRQGGIMFPTLYMLDLYEQNHLGFRIGSIQTASPTCADDIVLLSEL